MILYSNCFLIDVNGVYYGKAFDSVDDMQKFVLEIIQSTQQQNEDKEDECQEGTKMGS